MRIATLLALIFFQFGELRGQSLSNTQLYDDLIQLKNAIAEYNPALEVYNPKFNTNVDRLIAKIPKDSVSNIETFKWISQLCALSNEGHFALGSWKDKVHSGFLQNEYQYLPISIKIIKGSIYVWNDNSGEQLLNRGDEILSMNTMKAEDILSRLYSALPSDGSINTYQDRIIERGFSWMYYLYIFPTDSYHLEIKDTAGNTKKITIQGLTRDMQSKNFAKYNADNVKKKGGNEAFYTLEFKDNVAYLTLPSFARKLVEKFEVKSPQLYKTIFTQIDAKQMQHLVIDLRGNTGGRNEFADDMVPYILKGSVQSPFLRKTISWKGKEKIYKFPKPSKNAFKGNVYVLVNGRTYSAGSTLARYLYEYADATIVGEETGTRYEGFAAGSKQYVTLTNSQLEIGIPRYHIVFPVSEKQQTINKGLLPKINVMYTVEDLNNGKDIHMDKVHTLIEK